MRRINGRAVAAGLGVVVAAAGAVAAGVSGTAGARAVQAPVAWGTTPSAPISGGGLLTGVAAASATEVLAVGASGPAESAYTDVPYAERWDGTRWAVTNVPVPAVYLRQQAGLAAVTAAGPSDSWAVGSLGNASSVQAQTLAYHWNGSTWTRVATPNPAASDDSNQLTDVTARGSSDVWAVGASGLSPARSLLVHWDGTRWSQVSVPDIGALVAVTTDADSVWVASKTAVLHRTANGWTRLPTLSDPNGGGTPANHSIAVSGGNLWVVGARYDFSDGGFENNIAFAAYWNGSSWTAFDPPLRDRFTDALAAPGGVDVTSSSNHVYRLGTDRSAKQAVTPTAGVQLVSIATDPKGREWAVGDKGIITAPAIGRGGLAVSGGGPASLVTWLGPVNGTLAADDTGRVLTSDLPVGSYTLIVARSGCAPGVKKITVRAGEATVVNAPVVC